MYKVHGLVEGVAPILFNRVVDDSGIRDGTTGGKFTDDARMQEALLKVYRTDDGIIMLPSWTFKKTLMKGSDRAGLKEGRAAMSSFLAATVFLDSDPRFQLEDGTAATAPDYIHETMGRRPPRTGGLVLIKRPALKPGWKLPFTLNVVDDRRSPDHLRRALDEAGLICGFGDFRPEYGRFVVREWRVEREK